MNGSKGFLDRFPTLGRSGVNNLFLGAVRSGLTDPDAIVAAVEVEVQSQLSKPHLDAETRSKVGRVDWALREFPTEAMNLALHSLWWASLPKAERDRIKGEKAAFHLAAWMGSHPPTETQLECLKSLGYDGDLANGLEASMIIGGILQARRGR